MTGIPARLARALLRLMGDDGAVHASHEVLATEIGSAREVVSRQLAGFARSGLIATTRGAIAIVAPEGLRAVAGA
jgi:CRP/FNR family transcriptional regulator